MIDGVILCEGYHDRAFWSGLMEKLGCQDARTANGGTLLKSPGGIRLEKGAFGYLSTRRAFIKIVPCMSKENVRLEFKQCLLDRIQKPIQWIIVNVDADSEWQIPPTDYRKPRVESVMDVIRKTGVAAESRGDLFALDGGATTVGISVWACHDANLEGLPQKQTLERIICASLVAVYPERGPYVEQFLVGRPNPPRPNPKEHALAHLAGWYAENGAYETICRELWKDNLVASELEKRLTEIGVWSIALEMANLIPTAS